MTRVGLCRHPSCPHPPHNQTKWSTGSGQCLQTLMLSLEVCSRVAAARGWATA
jgi:hypothetical protein